MAVFDSTITLTNVNDGADGADGINGVNGTNGIDGLQGIQGIQGIQGTNGTNGTSSYAHIAYATSSNGSVGFSTSISANKTYIGMYTDSVELDSEVYTRYNWTLIKGADGSQGIPGVKGTDGLTAYLHIAYATNSTGSTGFSTTDSVGKTYIGQYTDNIPADSTLNTKYSWTLIKGADGADSDTLYYYTIDTTQQDIFKTYEEESGEKVLTFSPMALSFLAYQQSNVEKTVLGNEFVRTITLTRQDGSIFTYIPDGGTTNSTNIIPLLGQYYYASYYTDVDGVTNIIIPGSYTIGISAVQKSTPTVNINSTKDLQTVIASQNATVHINFVDGAGVIKFYKTIPIQFETTLDIATFNLYAGGFIAAAGEAGLNFNKDGLQLSASSFEMVDNNNKKVLYADESGNLVLAGKLEAATGTFLGELVSPTGRLGGFILRENSILSDDTENPSIALFGGTEGKIIAKNIELGIGAKIQDYLQLGLNTFLYNPDKHDGVFLKSGPADNILLKNNGYARLGALEIDGENATLRSSTVSPKWEINKDGSAKFDNIKINSASIGTTVLEVDTVQAVGSSMIFKETSRLLNFSANRLTLTLENTIGMQTNDWVYLIYQKEKILRKIVSYNSTTKLCVINSAVPSNFLKEETILVYLGSSKTNGLNCIFSISSGEAGADFMHSRSLALSEISEDVSGNLVFNKKLVLGDLSGLNTSSGKISGFGLYGENVYLTGSLVTELEDGASYAGINTLNGVKSNKFPGIDDSQIVFWAGSANTSESAIQESDFQVTQSGSIYANRGKFTGSVISNSYIQASKLYATEIYGGTEENSAALKIYDTAKGIVFYRKETNSSGVSTYIETLGIKENGLTIGTLGITPKYFIKIEGGLIKYTGDIATIGEYKTEATNGLSLSISKNIISLQETVEATIVNKGGITFDKDEIKILINTKEKINLTEDTATVDSLKTTLTNNVIFGEEGNSFIDFRRSSTGYDLYVFEAKPKVFGLYVDMTTNTFTRLEDAVGLSAGTLFNEMGAFGGRRRCIVTDSGVVLRYFGEDGYTETGALTKNIYIGITQFLVGTPVQVMVEQPKFYYKVEPLLLEAIVGGKGYHLRKANYYVSDFKFSGFKLHPAFLINGVEKDFIYHSAFEGSIFDTSANAYLLADEQVADFNADKLCSIANAKPCSGLTQLLTRPNTRKLAQNRGSGWQLQFIHTMSASQLLFMIEYASFNSQTAIGLGVVNKASGTGNESELTGKTSSLGNSSGMASGTNGLVSVTYRGEENIWGNIWKFTDGMNVYAYRIHDLYVSNYGFADNIGTTPYQNAGITLAKTSGYVSAFGYNEEFDWLFMPSETLGNSTIPVGDYLFQNNAVSSWLFALLGGRWSTSAKGGGFGWSAGYASSSHARDAGGRLVYVPQ